MRTHAEVNARFVALDREPALMRLAFDGWLAWPIVKETLWLYCLNTLAGGGRSDRVAVGRLPRLSGGLYQLLRETVAGRPAAGAMLYEPRAVRLPDGRSVHPHLGDLSAIEREGAWLHYRFGWGDGRELFPAPGHLEDVALSSLSGVAAILIRRLSDVRSAAQALLSALSPALQEIDGDTLHELILNQLCRFRSRFLIGRRLFRRAGLRRVVVLDPDGKTAEVAAAKSLGLPVIEVQHGMFSASEPDYSWTAAHRAGAVPLPLPDRIVVFGPLWRRQLLAAGYWRGDEILEVQAPVLGDYRRLRQARAAPPEGTPLQVLFPTQAYLRAAAIPFWRAALARQAEEGAARFHLRIKVHPLERTDAAHYGRLAEAFPEAVTVSPPGREAFDEMLDADVVAGFTSLMLVEALGLGIPVLALQAGAAREGLAETYLAPELDEIATPCTSPDDAHRQLGVWFDRRRLQAQSRSVAEQSRRIYCDDARTVEETLVR